MEARGQFSWGNNDHFIIARVLHIFFETINFFEIIIIQDFCPQSLFIFSEEIEFPHAYTQSTLR